MSLADVSKSMGELAAAITRKNQELDTLKEEYEKKLQLLDCYISHLQQNNSSSENIQNISQSLHDLSGPVTCPQCSTILFDLQKDSDFVLIPKSILKSMSFQIRENETNEKTQTLTQDLEALDLKKAPNSKHSNNNNKNNSTTNKSKRTCSYCHKNGHSRARCFKRLSRDPQNPESGTSTSS